MDLKYYKQHEPFWGSWYITKLIGQGNFGKVFEIERQEFDETYRAALKIITVPQNESEIKNVLASGMDQASVAEYFEGMAKEIVSEFKLMSTLKGNSCVVSYEDHQVITHENGLGRDILIRMELLTPLIDYIQTNKMTRRDVIKLGIDMCNALELCQKRNIIHRDIKPENIFVSEDGHFKLGDFGIARTIEKTSSGLSKKGTYTYMAPEIYKNEAYGSSVDIYSLGIVMYRLLNNNRTPFLSAYPEKIKHSDVDNALILRIGGKIIPKPSEADGRLAEIVLKACAYNSKERYSSPMEMRSELEAILYKTEESKIIYPKGDEVAVKPNEYVDTEDGEDSFETQNDEGTVSIFGEAPRETNEDKSQSEEVKQPVKEEEREETSTDDLTPPSEPRDDEGEGNRKYVVWGLVAGIILVFALVMIFRPSETDAEDYIVEQLTETVIEEATNKDEEYVAQLEPASEEEPVIPEYITIQGVQYSTLLTELELRNMGLTNEDIISLRYMKNLVSLNLSNFPDDENRNEIGDLTPLSNLTNLEELWLINNQVSDVSFLSNLTNLEVLRLDINQISDVNPLSNLTKLRSLSLSRNQVDDVSSLSDLTNLEFLLLDGNQISDVSPLLNLINLTSLNLSDNNLSDNNVSLLSSLTSLTDLMLRNSQISDLNFLLNLTNLTRLDLRDNQLSNIDVSPLSSLTSLTDLTLSENRISDLSFLSNLSNLRWLYLGGNQISDTSPLSNLSNLTVLHLDNNQISDISPLSSLSNLIILWVQGNQINDWSPVSHVSYISK